jgi:hypothetical protein
VKKDSELLAFQHNSENFNARVHQELASIPVPPTLRDLILARRKIVRPSFWRRGRLLLATAAALALIAGGLTLVRHERTSEDLTFAGFRSRMVGFALREYRMDVLTTDLGELKRFLANGGRPAEFSLPQPLAQIPLKGGACLSWQGKPVSMVCFDSPSHETIYLFVISDPERDLMKSAPRLESVKNLPAISWNSDGQTFLIAGKVPDEFLKGVAGARNG